ncbi:hypothetical protein [Cohnella silvisoli]|uniref:Twin-arginine translocation signal domain-containing protein n=1 Tax=Cohnella silvisoli TaxID=2873699 RepID=A0ABV1KS76_9BACL|nr:hypothetical protein [Cohnella silvisoli]MCD9021680.1 hypothetical protein [Cohnella silvisoli]
MEMEQLRSNLYVESDSRRHFIRGSILTIMAAVLGPSFYPYLKNAFVPNISVLEQQNVFAPDGVESLKPQAGKGAFGHYSSSDWISRMHSSQAAFLKVGEPYQN